MIIFMGIDANFIRLTKQEVEEIKNTVCVSEIIDKILDKYFDFLESGKTISDDLIGQELTYSLGSDWQVLHYILTGEIACPGKSLLLSPACNIIIGKNLENYYDKVYYLTPNEVRDVADFLKERPISWMKKEICSLVQQIPMSIYNIPSVNNRDILYITMLLWKYERLCLIYLEAAKVGNGMLVWFG
jgi:Domain of unknown function (DUF1877)